MFWSAVIALSCLVAYAHGHGRLDVPANRASLWRTGLFSDAPPNYDDDGLNCGGFYHQHSVNGGRCGICGDAYDNAQPRAHELGGKYGQGHIVATYEQGEVISTKVYISAYHQGYWEFRLCLDPSDQTQECFANFLLELEDGGTKYYPKGTGYYDVNYRLPSNVVCEHCVLQWKYTAGNNWGVCADGTGALGCGDQENFFSCSDISIKGSESIPLDVPIVNLNDILRLLILTNQIRDVRPSYSYSSSRKKYMNRHKRKKLNKKTKLKAKRGHKKFTYHR